MQCRQELLGKKSIEELPGYCIDYRVESGVMAYTLSERTRRYCGVVWHGLFCTLELSSRASSAEIVMILI
jgi:hypothetical protein